MTSFIYHISILNYNNQTRNIICSLVTVDGGIWLTKKFEARRRNQDQDTVVFYWKIERNEVIVCIGG